MAKRGRKPKVQHDESYSTVDGPVKENFLEMEEELLHHVDSADIEKYIRPSRKFQSYANEDEDSFAFWYGQN
jgi:hypothetical protein